MFLLVNIFITVNVIVKVFVFFQCFCLLLFDGFYVYCHD